MKNKEYYEGLDKRTKEYKEWKKYQEQLKETPYNKSLGLGDVVEKVTEVTGIKKVVKAIWGDDCGCKERKERLNNLFKRKDVKILEEDEYNYLVEFYGRSKSYSIPRSDVRELIKIHNRVMHTGFSPNTSCGKCVQTCYKNLKQMIGEYQD